MDERTYRFIEAKARRAFESRIMKLQFSKLHVLFADLLVFLVYASNFILVWNNKQPISDIAISIISVYGAFATGGYFTLCGVRDCSINKHGLHQHNKEEPQ